MIPPNQGSSLFEDSFLNNTPRENFYISGYKGPNEISKDILEMVQNLISMVQFSDPEYETVTCGSMYKFDMLNSLETSHLGKTIISSNR